MEFDNSSPIYQQIVDLFKAKIISGEFETGSKIKAVRDLASKMGVNPNTMQKALTALEQEKLVYAERTSGRFVTTDSNIIEELRNEMRAKEIERFLTNMEAMGYSEKDVLSVLKDFIENKGIRRSK